MSKSQDVTVSDAWACLGRDPGSIFRRIASHPSLDGRLAEAESALVEARRVAKALMSAYHPDRGGDPDQFVKVQAALKCIEESTESFRAVIEKKKAYGDERPVRKGTFIVSK